MQKYCLKYSGLEGGTIPEDPTELSYWVAQNLPLDDSERIVLLNYDCAIPRLQWEIKYLVKVCPLTKSSKCNLFIFAEWIFVFVFFLQFFF